MRNNVSVTADLSRVYRASVLPDVEGPGGFVDDPMTTDQWMRLFNSLGESLGDFDGYCKVFDPVELCDEDPMAHGLADDLADIYRDVSVGLDTRDDPFSDSLVETWRYSFRSHWGMHAANAICVIQARIAYHGLGEDD